MILIRLAIAFLASIGRSTIGLLAATGRVAIFAGETVSHIVRPPLHPAETGRQLLRIGYFSLPVVGLTALFTGAALGAPAPCRRRAVQRRDRRALHRRHRHRA